MNVLSFVFLLGIQIELGYRLSTKYHVFFINFYHDHICLVLGIIL